MENMKNIIKRTLLLAFFLTLRIVGFAQHDPGPYTFNPFLGNMVWMDEQHNTQSSRTITMNELQPLENDQDGLIVVFNVHLSSSEDMIPLVALSREGSNGNNIIEIYYSKHTVTVRRFFDLKGKRRYYDYHLFDPLFDFTGQRDFEFRTYFTSNFMYLVSKDLSRNPGFQMSPIYFGLDQGLTYKSGVNGSNMGMFINRDSRASIKVGDFNGAHTPFVSGTQIYGMRYGDWWKQMQGSFSSPESESSF